MADSDPQEERELNRFYPAAKMVTAIFVDNFYVTGSPGLIRIAFGESAAEPVGTQYRVAVALPIDDAKELVRVVGQMVGEIEEEAAAKIKE